MEFLTYIQKLQSELEALRIPQDTIHTVITQESALAETKSTDVQPGFFTPDRLQSILAQAKQLHASYSAEVYDEDKTIIPQDNAKNHAFPIQDEEKTILPTSPKATIQSLSDEATMVVISGISHKDLEEKTIAASPNLKKLLSENETVRISEKNTGSFPCDPDRTHVISTEDATVQVRCESVSVADTEATLPPHTPKVTPNIPLDEQTRPISTKNIRSTKEPVNNTPPIDSPPQETNAPSTQKNTTIPASAPLSPEMIRNPYPFVSFFWLAFLLIPSIGFLVVLIVSFIVLTNLFFLVAFTAVMLFYLAFLLVPLFLALYSFIFSFLYWKDARIAEGITELGLALFSSGLSLMFGYLFYRPFIATSEWIGEKCRSFNKKTFILIRNLYRYSVKGAEKL